MTWKMKKERWVSFGIIVLLTLIPGLTQANKGQAVHTSLITGLIGLHEGANCAQVHSHNSFHVQALKWTLARFNQVYFKQSGFRVDVQIIDTCNLVSTTVQTALKEVVGQRATEPLECRESNHLGFVVSPNQAHVVQLLQALNVSVWEMPKPQGYTISQLEATTDLLTELAWKFVVLLTSDSISTTKFKQLATIRGICITRIVNVARNSSSGAYSELLTGLESSNVVVLIGTKFLVHKILTAASNVRFQGKFVIVPYSDFLLPSDIQFEVIRVSPLMNKVPELDVYSQFNLGITTTIWLTLQHILSSLSHSSDSRFHTNTFSPKQTLLESDVESILYTAFREESHLIQLWVNDKYVNMGNVSYQSLKLNKSFKKSVQSLTCQNCSCKNLITTQAWQIVPYSWVLPTFIFSLLHLLLILGALTVFTWKRGCCLDTYLLGISTSLLVSVAPLFFQTNSLLCLLQPALSSSALHFFLSTLLAKAITVITKPQKYSPAFQGLLLFLLLVLNLVYTSCLTSWDEITQAFRNNVPLARCSCHYIASHFCDELVLLLVLLACCPILHRNNRLTGFQISAATYSVAVGCSASLALDLALYNSSQGYAQHYRQFLFILATNIIVDITFVATTLSRSVIKLHSRGQAQSQTNLVNSEHVPNTIGTSYM